MNALPSDLCALRDAAVEHALTGCPLPADFKRLHEWLEEDGRDALETAYVDGGFMLKLPGDLHHDFSDDELRHDECMGEDEPVTDAMRVCYFRERLERIISNDDQYTMKGVHGFKVERADGKSAFIGGLLELHGQSGLFVDWQGVFPNQGAFINHLRETGFRWIQELERLDDTRIVAVWHAVQERD